MVTRELRTDLGALLSTVIVAETLGEQLKRLVVSVPVGMLIQPGVRVHVDGAEDLEARYVICVSYSCYAELAIDAAFIDALKVGNTLRLTAVNQMGKPVEFDLILAGFAAAYDGKAMDPAEVAERQEKILRALEAVILGEKDYVVIE
ncbi:MAG: invasion associated locus B family protein [Devosia sp.]